RLSQQYDVQLLAQLLVLLDGLETRGQVAVLATTNRLEAVDPAVCRPGRFDYHIEVACPDRAGRAAILQVCLAKMKTTPGLHSEAGEHTLEGVRSCVSLTMPEHRHVLGQRLCGNSDVKAHTATSGSVFTFRMICLDVD